MPEYIQHFIDPRARPSTVSTSRLVGGQPALAAAVVEAMRAQDLILPAQRRTIIDHNLSSSRVFFPEWSLDDGGFFVSRSTDRVMKRAWVQSLQPGMLLRWSVLWLESGAAEDTNEGDVGFGQISWSVDWPTTTTVAKVPLQASSTETNIGPVANAIPRYPWLAIHRYDGIVPPPDDALTNIAAGSAYAKRDVSIEATLFGRGSPVSCRRNCGKSRLPRPWTRTNRAR